MQTCPISPTSAQASFGRAMGVVFLALLAFWFFYQHPSLPAKRLDRELLAWTGLILLLWGYWRGYQAISVGGVSFGRLMGSALVITFTATMILPFHSTDVFGYINRGWQQFHYGLNPYGATISSIPGWAFDPMITDHWVNNPSPYGFLYLQIAKGLSALGGGDIGNTLLVFKLFNLLVYWLVGLLIWVGTSRLSRAGSRHTPRIAFYLFALNPLMLIHVLANGHNDILMGFFIVLSAVFVISGAWIWSLPALTAATLIKYGALAIVPVAVLFLLRQKAWIALFGGLIISVLVFAISGWPYLADWQSFHLKEIGQNAFVSHGSLHSMIFTAYKTLGKEWLPVLYENREAVRELLKTFLLGGFVIFFGALIWRRAKQVTYDAFQFTHDALLTMGVLVCLVSLKFYPWYFGMFFPLALLLPEGQWLRRLMIVMSCAQMLAITFVGQAHILNFILMTALPIVWIVRKHRQTWRSSRSGKACEFKSTEQPLAL